MTCITFVLNRPRGGSHSSMQAQVYMMKIIHHVQQKEGMVVLSVLCDEYHAWQNTNIPENEKRENRGIHKSDHAVKTFNHES